MKKFLSLFLSIICIWACIVLPACAMDTGNKSTLPIAYEKENFSFAITWNTYGISSYDSQTGVLIKTKDAPNPEDFSTVCTLTETQLIQIYEILLLLNLDEYPNEYAPSEYASAPSLTYVLTVRNGEKSKTVNAPSVPLGDDIAKDEKAQKFLDACNAIIDILENTDEWKTFPDYPYLYD